MLVAAPLFLPSFRGARTGRSRKKCSLVSPLLVVSSFEASFVAILDLTIALFQTRRRSNLAVLIHARYAPSQSSTCFSDQHRLIMSRLRLCRTNRSLAGYLLVLDHTPTIHTINRTYQNLIPNHHSPLYLLQNFSHNAQKLNP